MPEDNQSGCSQCPQCDISPEEAPENLPAEPTDVPLIVVNPPDDDQADNQIYSSDYNSYDDSGVSDDSDNSNDGLIRNADYNSGYDYDSDDMQPPLDNFEPEIEANWAYWSSWSTCDVECSANGNTGTQEKFQSLNNK